MPPRRPGNQGAAQVGPVSQRRGHRVVGQGQGGVLVSEARTWLAKAMTSCGVGRSPNIRLRHIRIGQSLLLGSRRRWPLMMMRPVASNSGCEIGYWTKAIVENTLARELAHLASREQPERSTEFAPPRSGQKLSSARLHIVRANHCRPSVFVSENHVHPVRLQLLQTPCSTST